MWRDRLARALSDAKFEGKASRLRACSTRFRYLACAKHGAQTLQTNRCGVYGCPVCQDATARDKARLTAAQFAAAKKAYPSERGAKRKLLFLTLTIRSGANAGHDVTAEYLRCMLSNLFFCWGELWRDISTMAHGGLGGVVRGPKGGTKRLRNPGIGAWVKGEVGADGACHLHVLLWGLNWLENRSREKGYRSGWRLRDRWKEITGSHVVNLQLVTGRRKGKRWRYDPEVQNHAGGIVEFAKYVAKPAGSGAYAVETGVAVTGFRVWRRYGSARNTTKPEEFDPPVCPHCGPGAHTPWIYGQWESSIQAAAAEILAFPLPRGPPEPVKRQLSRAVQQDLDLPRIRVSKCRGTGR